jgi:hypothetical protein
MTGLRNGLVLGGILQDAKAKEITVEKLTIHLKKVTCFNAI